MNTKPSISSRQAFQRLAFLLLLYTLLVIVWGAWVRISQSGDGCGDHWPLCHGEFIPGTSTFIPAKKTWIEYSHRLMSGSFGLIVIAMYTWARRLFPREHSARKAALFAVVLMITEALLGANLVLFGLVMKNDSPLRTLTMSLHMINSLLLVASIALLWQNCQAQVWTRREYLNELGRLRPVIGWGLVLFLVLAVSGAIAALASTLFPTESLTQGLAEDLNPDSHYLIRWRLLHPILGFLLGGTFAGLGWWLAGETKDSAIRKASWRLAYVASFAVPFGIVTLLSLAPVWMKLSHLLLAHAVWICLILLWRNLRWRKL